MRAKVTCRINGALESKLCSPVASQERIKKSLGTVSHMHQQRHVQNYVKQFQKCLILGKFLRAANGKDKFEISFPYLRNEQQRKQFLRHFEQFSNSRINGNTAVVPVFLRVLYILELAYP